jgi:hypothetical protein
MLIAFSALVNNAAGSCGGICAQNTIAGVILRPRSIPTNPNSAAQLLNRAALATISQLWRSSSMSTYRIGWINLANANPYTDQFGNAHKLTGSAFFQKLNHTLATLGLSSILAAPSSVSCGNPSTITATHVLTPTETFTITPSVGPAAAEAVVIRVTKPLSPGVNQIGQTQTIIQTFPAGTAGPWNILTAYKKKNSAIATGDTLYAIVNYVNTTTGFAGTQISDQATW